MSNNRLIYDNEFFHLMKNIPEHRGAAKPKCKEIFGVFISAMVPKLKLTTFHFPMSDFKTFVIAFFRQWQHKRQGNCHERGWSEWLSVYLHSKHQISGKLQSDILYKV